MRFMLLVLLSFVSTASLHGAENTESYDTITGKVASVELSPTDTVLYKRVNIAIGEVLVLAFPEGITLSDTPVLGDSALLKVEMEQTPLTVKVWGLLFPDVPETQMYGLNTNLQFSLNSGTTLIINFRIAPPPEATNRIVVTFPEFTRRHDAMQRMLVNLKNKLHREHEKKMAQIDTIAETRKREMLTRSFAEFFSCKTYRSRAQDRLVFLMSDRICKIGGDSEKTGEIYINFVVKNRYRNYFYVREVRVYALKNSGRIPLEHEVFLEKYGIQFDEVLNGAVGFTVGPDEYAPEYMIEVVEEAGKQRKIQLTVGF